MTRKLSKIIVIGMAFIMLVMMFVSIFYNPSTSRVRANEENIQQTQMIEQPIQVPQEKSIQTPIQ